uniref:Uncharacterized protein n=1 Tax=Cucumis melo TaxID=3656 RepID=A0A9I9DE07_CUCME
MSLSNLANYAYERKMKMSSNFGVEVCQEIRKNFVAMSGIKQYRYNTWNCGHRVSRTLQSAMKAPDSDYQKEPKRGDTQHYGCAYCRNKN